MGYCRVDFQKLISNAPKKWAPKSKSDRYEPWMPLDERIRRVRRRFSAGEHYQRRLAVFDVACAQIDRDKYVKLQGKYATEMLDFAPSGPMKYIDVVYWIWHKTEQVVRLDLDRKPPMSILDIGLGGGHFLFLCKALGHSCVGIDIEVPLYDDICETLGVEHFDTPVYANSHLPSLGRFDLVTAMWIMFNMTVRSRHKRKYWSAEEWAWLFSDISRQMADDGALHLELNQHVLPEGIVWDEPFVDACERAGAVVDRSIGRFITLRKPDMLAYRACAE